MGYTQWILVQDSDLAFGFVPDRQYGAFHAGNLPLQQVRPGEVRTVEVVLHWISLQAASAMALRRLRIVVNWWTACRSDTSPAVLPGGTGICLRRQ